MAPTRSKKRKSTESEGSVDIHSFPAPAPRIIPTKTHSPARTPIGRSPMKRAPMGITLNQKQALIDNLQLEVTERARKLRAQYMLHAQGLRTRIEMRVNRIPTALRKAKMGELFAKHHKTVEKQYIANTGASAKIQGRLVASPSKNLLQEYQSQTRHSPSPMRSAKRMSDQMTDKENGDLANPKKRTKGPAPPPRTTSRAKTQPDQVLSPRSANSRTLPRSPIRPVQSPSKSALTRPMSPLKPSAPSIQGGAAAMLTSMVEKAKSTRTNVGRKVTTSSTASSAAGAGRGKRAPVSAPAPKVGKGRASNISESSEASNSTTIVKKAAPVKKAPVKRTVIGTIRGIGGGAAKKAATPKVAAPATTGRVLRKR